MKKLAKLIFTTMFALTAGAAAAQSTDPNVPLRPSLYGNSVGEEAWNRQLLQKGKPGEPLVKDLHPSFAGQYSRVLNAHKINGILKPLEHGAYQIDRHVVIFINVDWRDRGYVKEAKSFLEKFEGKPAEAICRVHLVNGPFVCDVWVKDGDKDLNLSAELLRRGWYGWQTETGGAGSPAASKAATEAYWNYRGVWSNKWYFPDGSIRNAYAAVKLK